MRALVIGGILTWERMKKSWCNIIIQKKNRNNNVQ
jgi:hypothetical protein